MIYFERHLRAAWGYMELGMAHDADAELLRIAPEMRANVHVVRVRIEILRALGKWRAMEAFARTLCHSVPGSAEGWLSLARAKRGAGLVRAARNILLDVACMFPDEAKVAYELACYEAQLGNFTPARQSLRKAISLDGRCRKVALGDPDLRALYGDSKPPHPRPAHLAKRWKKTNPWEI